MGRQVFSLFPILLLLPASLTAQGTQLVPKDAQALAIIEQSRAAMGGVAAMLSYQDSVATGTLLLTGPKPQQWPIVLKSKGRTLVRVELQKPKGQATRILNSGRAVLLEADGRRRNLVGNNTLAEGVGHIPLLSFLADAEKPEVAVEFAGPGKVNGASTYAVALNLSSLTSQQQTDELRAMTRTIFHVDQTTGLVTKTEETQFAENDTGAQQKVETLFADYRPVNGILVPFRQSMYADGQLEAELILDSVSFNVGLSDSEFQIPAEASDAK
jgi:outer membrane lipoprotein-sorting protein